MILTCFGVFRQLSRATGFPASDLPAVAHIVCQWAGQLVFAVGSEARNWQATSGNFARIRVFPSSKHSTAVAKHRAVRRQSQ